MNATLELIFVLLTILGSLVLGQVMRENNYRVIHEKFFALAAGLAIGLALRFFSMSILDWLPGYCQVFLYFFLIEKVFTMPRALIYSRIGTIILLITLAGGLSLVSGYLILGFALNNLKLHIEVLHAVQLICVFLVPGGCFGVEKDLEYQLFINSQVFSVLFVYPFASLLPEGPANFFKGWTVGLVLGIVCGVLGSVLLKYIKISKSWNSLEVFSTGLISLLAALSCKPIGGCSIVSLTISGIILSKYAYVSDISLITRNNLYVSISGLIEILIQIWLGVQIATMKIEYQYFTLLILIVAILFVSYAATKAAGHLCKLKNIKILDCLNFVIGGIKGVGSVSVLVLLPEETQEIAILGLVILNFIGMAFGYFISSGKDESSYLISSNPCSKLKGYLQNFEETYLLPVFVKENAEKSILSPKFNENSQRFDAGIQMRPENRDETSRELQALNLNMTETEMQGVLQLK